MKRCPCPPGGCRESTDPRRKGICVKSGLSLASCPTTGVGKPECSCKPCQNEIQALHLPKLLDEARILQRYETTANPENW